MKTWRFTFKCEYFGAQAEFPFFVDADTYHDATIIADAYIKEKFPIACEQDLATIKFEGLGIDPKDWGKSKRELQEPCEYCTTVDWETDFWRNRRTRKMNSYTKFFLDRDTLRAIHTERHTGKKVYANYRVEYRPNRPIRSYFCPKKSREVGAKIWRLTMY